MKKLDVDLTKMQVTAPLFDYEPRIVLLSEGQAGLLELPPHCEVHIKVHDGRITFANVTEKHAFRSLIAN